MIKGAFRGTYQQFANLLKEGVETAGEEFEVTRGDERLRFKGMRNREKNGGRRYIGFLPGSDIQEGDLLVGTVSGDQLYVTEVERHLLEGQVLQVKAYGQTPAQREAMGKHPAGPTFHIGNAVGSVIGTQASVNINIAWNDIEQRVQERGGSDRAELTELIVAVRRLVEEEGGVRAGSLSRFSALLERHSWITGAIAQALLAMALGKAG